jgi:methylthioribose-1-phosphate isomerase
MAGDDPSVPGQAAATVEAADPLAPEAIVRLERDAVVMLDQTQLPGRAAELTCTRWQEVADAIRRMSIRGAPAIGIAAAYGVALAARTSAATGLDELRADVDRACAGLASARPTAVNLSWAVERMRARAAAPHADPDALRGELAAAAERIHRDEVDRCRRIGDHGAELIRSGAQVLTHCNAGALATGGYGTALGIIRSAHRRGGALHVWVDETRPLLQGARLTAWELEREGVPATLVTDSTAGWLMAQGKVDAVLTGADRIARNGDCANKIGTYGVAVLARAHSVPFYVAAPTSTIDPGLPTGEQIPIEHRAAVEVTGVHAPESVGVYNPAFDVTPAALIAAIVTEEGVHRPPYAFG